MKFLKTSVLIYTSLILFCTSCSDDNDKPSDILEGTWETHCKTSVSDGRLNFSISKNTYKDSSVTGSDIIYKDSSCTEKVSEIKFLASYVIGDPVSDIDGAKNIDLVLKDTTLTLYSSELADIYNDNNFLGHNDWEINSPKSLLGQEFNSGCGAITQDSVLYDIFKIDGNRLYSGENTSICFASSEIIRPLDLDLDYLVRSGSAAIEETVTIDGLEGEIKDPEDGDLAPTFMPLTPMQWIKPTTMQTTTSSAVADVGTFLTLDLQLITSLNMGGWRSPDPDYPYLNAKEFDFGGVEKTYEEDGDEIVVQPISATSKYIVPREDFFKLSNYMQIMWGGTTCYLVINPIDKEMILIDPYVSKMTMGSKDGDYYVLHHGLNRIVRLANKIRELGDEGYKLMGILVSHMHGDHVIDLGALHQALTQEPDTTLSDNESLETVSTNTIEGSKIDYWNKIAIISDKDGVDHGFCSKGYSDCKNLFTHWLQFKHQDGTPFRNQSLLAENSGVQGGQGLSIKANLIKKSNPEMGSWPCTSCNGTGNTGKGSFTLGHYEIMPIVWNHWNTPDPPDPGFWDFVTAAFVFITTGTPGSGLLTFGHTYDNEITPKTWKSVAFKIWHNEAPNARETLFTPSLPDSFEGWLDEHTNGDNFYYSPFQFFLAETGGHIYTDHVVYAWQNSDISLFGKDFTYDKEDRKEGSYNAKLLIRMHERESNFGIHSPFYGVYIPHYVISSHVDPNSLCGTEGHWINDESNSMYQWFLKKETIGFGYYSNTGINWFYYKWYESTSLNNWVIFADFKGRLGCDF